jgi:hypothetical protein
MRQNLIAALLLIAATGTCATRAVVAAPPLEDPTRPSNGRGERAAPGWPQLRLQGILHHGNESVAIIDGRLVHSGDHLGDARIGEIGTDAVHYQRGGHELIAYLAKSTLQVRRLTALPKDSP